jgi:CBS domain-containing protein
MLTAQEIMTKEVMTVSPETSITEAARLLLEKRINGLPVVDSQGRLTGIICQSDLITQQKQLPLPPFVTFLDSFIPLSSYKNFEKQIQKIAALTVIQAMTRDPITVEPEASLEEIATLMVTKSIHTLPVTDQGQLVGIIGKEDVLRTLMPRKEEK